MPGIVVSSAVSPLLADEDDLDVHSGGEGVGSQAAWEECDWEVGSRKPRDGLDFVSTDLEGKGYGGHGASGRWRACVGPATCPMHICVRARACVRVY